MAMKISTFGYYAREGVHSIFRHKMMSIASVTTVMASLIIFGIFFITMANVNFMVKNVEASVEVKVYLKDDVTDDQMSEIESQLKETSGVTDVEYESKQQALENFKKQLGEKADLVDGIDAEEVMSKAYIIKMESPKFVDGVVQKLNSFEGIDKIYDARPIMDRLMQITGFVRVLGLCLMGVLLVVSVFLISNTIKLTVMARKREIGIMKYIGATDWFIRWPFVIEGIILGLLGAILSGVVLGYGYVVASDTIAANLMIVKLVDPLDVIPYMLAIFAAVGFVIGSLGSIISMRKFLRV